ncbi:MAG TPA: serine hydrolase domain-containing protein [Acidimicrobiales bacterium]|nr:serine hydrolase domain-containing protein [Acidimicrobiales bacterium]
MTGPDQAPSPARGAARALELVTTWPATAAAGVTGPAAVCAVAGPADRVFAWASVTKLLTALATLVAVEEGSIALDDPAGPPGSTVRHLLAHASGLPFDGDTPVAAPGTTRIYSNSGFDALATALAAATDMPAVAYIRDAVVSPLGLAATALEGSPASGAHGPLTDLLALGRELLAPTLVAPETLGAATSVAFPQLAGILPGFGRHSPNDWGLGFELRDHKAPHWTGARNSPATFGHFGRAGSFLWVDPAAGVACAALADRDFGPWAAAAWPELADAVLAELGADPSR